MHYSALQYITVHCTAVQCSKCGTREYTATSSSVAMKGLLQVEMTGQAGGGRGATGSTALHTLLYNTLHMLHYAVQYTIHSTVHCTLCTVH